MFVISVVVVVGRTEVVVVIGVTSHTSPTPSPSLSRWSLTHNPLDEQPITQSASLVQVMPGLSEVAEQVPRFEPLGLLGQLSSVSRIPSLSESTCPLLTVVVVVGLTIQTGNCAK